MMQNTVFPMFYEKADKIFEAAGVDKTKYSDLYEQAAQILSTKMAIVSATMGLSQARVAAYEEQVNTLIQDLKDMKASGDIT